MHVFTSFVLFEGEKFHGGGRVWYFNVIWLKSIHTFTFIVTVFTASASIRVSSRNASLYIAVMIFCAQPYLKPCFMCPFYILSTCPSKGLCTALLMLHSHRYIFTSLPSSNWCLLKPESFNCPIAHDLLVLKLLPCDWLQYLCVPAESALEEASATSCIWSRSQGNSEENCMDAGGRGLSDLKLLWRIKIVADLVILTSLSLRL